MATAATFKPMTEQQVLEYHISFNGKERYN